MPCMLSVHVSKGLWHSVRLHCLKRIEKNIICKLHAYSFYLSIASASRVKEIVLLFVSLPISSSFFSLFFLSVFLFFPSIFNPLWASDLNDIWIYIFFSMSLLTHTHLPLKWAFFLRNVPFHLSNPESASATSTSRKVSSTSKATYDYSSLTDHVSL